MAGSWKKTSTPTKNSFGAKPQSSTKRNSSLLNFFQKADGPPKTASRQSRITQFTTSNGSPTGSTISPRPRPLRRGDSASSNGNEGLFFEDKAGIKRIGKRDFASDSAQNREKSQSPDDFWAEEAKSLQIQEGEERYHEDGTSVKRQKCESDPDTGRGKKDATPPKPQKTSGPFIDESDSEGDFGVFEDSAEGSSPDSGELEPARKEASPGDDRMTANRVSTTDMPPPVRDNTSHTEYNEFTNFDDVEEDEFQGEECFLGTIDDEEELQEETFDLDDLSGFPTLNDDNIDTATDNAPVCPICQSRLAGLNETDILVHVNECLDGKPNTGLPKENLEEPSKGPTRAEGAAIAKPAQRDPFNSDTRGKASAFSKIMAGNAEDSAWATAAASDVASRGKQAYRRTCPFYKIISGFSISVDAFRYGAVDGCNAYFLSHFHSDHYIGLTSSWRHGPIYCSKPTANLVRQQLKVDQKWLVSLEFERRTDVPETGGVQVTMIEANHCPGSALFLFEKAIGPSSSKRIQRILHCGDFRASPSHVQHALLRPETNDPVTGQPRQQRIDVCYLDTTYLNPKYSFPSQGDVISACAELCVRFDQGQDVGFGQIPWQAGNTTNKSKNPMNKFLSLGTSAFQSSAPGRLLVVIGTYSIGKERICLAIAKALKSKIYATKAKQRICACLEDPELTSLLTTNPVEAQVHMQTLFEIRAETLSEYLDSMKPHFSRIVGFRPTGWTYRPPAGRTLENPPVSTVLQWKTPFSARDLTPQRGSTRESACFGVPYSEHSSFRELTMFCCALRIGRVIPTVDVGSQKSRERMKLWFERWEAEKRKNGLFKVEGSEW